MATPSQLRVNRLMRTACKRDGIGPATLKHRGLSGTNTAVGNNTVLRPRSGASALENTTDFQVWMAWTPMKVRGNASEGGDGPAGRMLVARALGQCAAIDINNNAISINDDDWIVAPNGALFKIENPVPSPDGSHYNFEMVSQR